MVDKIYAKMNIILIILDRPDDNVKVINAYQTYSKHFRFR